MICLASEPIAHAPDKAIEGTDMSDQLRDQGFEHSFFFALYQACGFALFLTWLFASLLGFTMFSADHIVLSELEHGVHLASLVAFALGLCLCGGLANRFTLFPSIRILAAILVIDCAVIAIAGVGMLPHPIVGMALCIVMNFAGGYQLVCWVAMLSRFSTTMTPFFIALSTALAALLGFLFLSFSYPFSSNLVMFALGASIAMMMLVVHRHPIAEHGVTKEASKDRRPLFWKTRIVFALFGFAFGGAFYASIMYDASPAMALALVVGATASNLDIWQAGGVMVDRMRRIIAIGAVISLLGIALFSFVGELFWWCVLMALFSYAFAMQTSWTILSARVFAINTVYMYVRGQRLFWIFLVAGWTVSWLITGIVNASLVVSSTVIALIVIMSLFFAHGDLEDLKLLAVKGDAEDFDVKRVSHFKQKCQAVAQRFELTPRETEVFILMAKGRNAESIGDELTISHYTAKTHIYHVYQKTGVNSRQAIIDMVEKYPTSELH